MTHTHYTYIHIWIHTQHLYNTAINPHLWCRSCFVVTTTMLLLEVTCSGTVGAQTSKMVMTFTSPFIAPFYWLQNITNPYYDMKRINMIHWYTSIYPFVSPHSYLCHQRFSMVHPRPASLCVPPAKSMSVEQLAPQTTGLPCVSLGPRGLRSTLKWWSTDVIYVISHRYR